MNTDPKSRSPLPRAWPIAVPVEEELETGEPIPDEEEPAAAAKKIPALYRLFKVRPVGQPEPE